MITNQLIHAELARGAIQTMARKRYRILPDIYFAAFYRGAPSKLDLLRPQTLVRLTSC